MEATGSLEPLDREGVLAAVDDLAHRGLRVLATAKRHAPRETGESMIDSLRGSLDLTRLQAMFDPPRPEAIAAVRACHTQAST